MMFLRLSQWIVTKVPQTMPSFLWGQRAGSHAHLPQIMHSDPNASGRSVRGRENPLIHCKRWESSPGNLVHQAAAVVLRV